MTSNLRTRPADPADFPTKLLQDEIERDLCTFSTALFGVDGPRGKLYGSGTFVQVGNSHFILTAAHVWQRLKRYPEIGIILAGRHRCVIPSEAIEGSRSLEPKQEEWGPDLVFLRVPETYTGSMRAEKTFYNLERQRILEGQFATWVLMGAPEVAGDFSSARHSVVMMMAYFSVVTQRHEKDGFDYLDLEAELSMPATPSSFGGISGGGLWRIQYSKNSSGEHSWTYELDGTAFYQSAPSEAIRFVRCHGMQSVGALIHPLSQEGG